MESDFERCDNEVSEEFNKCALHLSSEEVKNQDVDLQIINSSDLFINYLLEKVRCLNGLENEKDFDALKLVTLDDLKFNKFHDKGDVVNIISNSVLYIENIEFSKLEENILEDFSYIIDAFKKVYFTNCSFNNEMMSNRYFKYYSNCTFNEILNVKADLIYVDKSEAEKNESKLNIFGDKYRYFKCIFEEDVIVKNDNNYNYICYNLFYDCSFKKDVFAEKVRVNSSFIYLSSFKELFNKERKSSEKEVREHIEKYSFKNISIVDCEFDDSFKLNCIENSELEEIKSEYNCQEIELSCFTIKDFLIKDTKFRKKLELKNAQVNSISFTNSNVDGIFDLFKSKFERARFYKSIFLDFSGLEEVEFGKEGTYTEDYQTKFIYTTFMSFSNFRRAKFYSGLDFERVNLKEQPNFLRVFINPINTNRETFRIIKNSFDDVGNRLEANRFFTKEMQAYKNELYNTIVKENNDIIDLKSKGKRNEVKLYKNSEDYKKYRRARWVFNTNELISEFGENYFRPFFILIFSVIVYTLITLWNKCYFKKHEYVTSWDWVNNASWAKWYFESHDYFMSWQWFDVISKFLNEFAVNVLPFRIFVKDRNGIEFISLFFYIWFAILIWQIIIAVKRHTQR